MTVPKLPPAELAKTLMDAASAAALPNATVARQVLKAIDAFNAFFAAVYSTPAPAAEPTPAPAPAPAPTDPAPEA